MKKLWVWVGIPLGIGILLLLVMIVGSDSGAKANLQYISLESFDGRPAKLGYIDKKVGTGPALKRGDMAMIFITGKLKDGAVLLSNKKGKTLPVQVGTEQKGKGPLGPAVDSGLVGMKAGGIRELFVPPDLAFGEMGSPEAGIPPKSEVFLEIELVQMRQN